MEVCFGYFSSEDATRLLLVTIGLVVMLSMSATAFAFNPQPEPPGAMPAAGLDGYGLAADNIEIAIGDFEIPSGR